jgi:ubiquinone biosynthesis monooxygenase Coq7
MLSPSVGPRDALTIARIVRVNHAGEYGAIRIYGAQIEAAVHRHLEDQLGFLAGRDAELHAAILDIREEELSHLNHAEAQLAAPNLFRRLLRNVISVLTDMLIWLSTWGDSARMAADLRRRATG